MMINLVFSGDSVYKSGVDEEEGVEYPSFLPLSLLLISIAYGSPPEKYHKYGSVVFSSSVGFT
jgi:hypothetical protein